MIFQIYPASCAFCMYCGVARALIWCASKAQSQRLLWGPKHLPARGAKHQNTYRRCPLHGALTRAEHTAAAQQHCTDCHTTAVLSPLVNKELCNRQVQWQNGKTVANCVANSVWPQCRYAQYGSRTMQPTIITLQQGAQCKLSLLMLMTP